MAKVVCLELGGYRATGGGSWIDIPSSRRQLLTIPPPLLDDMDTEGLPHHNRLASTASYVVFAPLTINAFSVFYIKQRC